MAEAKQRVPSIMESERYVKFADYIDNITAGQLGGSQENTQPVDEDFMMEISQQVLTDPFTKQPIRDPVRNNRCNHVYDRTAIMDAMKANKRTKCAYVGCTNSQPVLKHHLEEDLALKTQIISTLTQHEEGMVQDVDENEESD
jgi:SUMO ligase MMS21 Smc5/6 complex component